MARTRMNGVFPEETPAHWNSAIPFPQPIRWGYRPVPNAQSVGPIGTAQFAPPYLPPGSGSVQPYVYQDGPWENTVPLYLSHPEALTPDGAVIERPPVQALGDVRANPCAHGNCGDYGEGFMTTPLVTLPIVGDVTPRCILGLAVGAMLGYAVGRRASR